MGQKVNPISLRLEQTNRHFDSCWFNDYNYTYLLNRDIKIQSYVNSILKQIRYCSARFFIQNLPNKIKINVFFINPKNTRKASAKAFQLRESLNLQEIRVTGNVNVRRQELQRLATKLNSAKKKLFLKKNKTQNLSKAKILNYFLLNTKNSSNQKNSILSVNNNSVISKSAFSNNRDKVSCNKKVNSIEIRKTENQNKVNLFLRYLLLKNFALKSGANFTVSRAQGFLFSNLINLKLLSHNNKLALITNCLQQKILMKKKDLQQNNLNNNTKFSKAYSNQVFSLKALNKQSNTKALTSYPNNINVKLEKTDGKQLTKLVVDSIEKTFNLLDRLYLSQKSSYSSLNLKHNNVSLNNNNRFLSLINNQLLSNTHYNLETRFKNFSDYSNKRLTGACFKNVKLLEHKGRPFNTHDNYKSNKTKNLFRRSLSYKTHLESHLSNLCFSDVSFSFFRFSNEKQSAIFLAEEIIYFLEKKVSFTRIKNKILREAGKSYFLKGLRVTCSGRVGGRSKKAQRSKVQVIKYGQTSLHVFSSKVDFCSKAANTTFGLLGVKVWICYN